MLAAFLLVWAEVLEFQRKWSWKGPGIWFLKKRINPGSVSGPSSDNFLGQCIYTVVILADCLYPLSWANVGETGENDTAWLRLGEHAHSGLAHRSIAYIRSGKRIETVSEYSHRSRNSWWSSSRNGDRKLGTGSRLPWLAYSSIRTPPVDARLASESIGDQNRPISPSARSHSPVEYSHGCFSVT
jgi:hypothetical protein